MGYASCANSEDLRISLENVSAYEIAWRIYPVQEQEPETRVSLETQPGSGPAPIYTRHSSIRLYNRYGDRLFEGWKAYDFIRDKLKTKTTIKIGVQATNGEFAWVAFKNISLVRGENQGFKIIEGEAGE